MESLEFFPLLLQEYSCRLSRNDASLQELNLKCCPSQDCFWFLLKKLQTKSFVKTLDLYGNDLTAIKGIAPLLRRNTCLRVLKLDKNRINVEELCNKGLHHNNYLKELSLDDNEIGPSGGVALGRVLATNCTIEKLSLRSNRLGTEGAVAIFKGIQTNPKSALQELNLSFNDIGGSAQALKELLCVSSSLKVLRLWCNGFSTDGAVLVAQGVKENTSLQELYMGQNNVGDEAAVAFADALCINDTLKKLYLHRNHITTEATRALLSAVRDCNYTIGTIKLDCIISHQVEQELEYWLEANRAGRGRVFQEATTLPQSLWPHVLADQQPNALHCFLQAKPDLFKL